MAVVMNSRPFVGAGGHVYLAPVATPAPTNFADPGPPWTRLGMVSDDGVSWALPDENMADVVDWRSAYPTRGVLVAASSSVSFKLAGWDPRTVPFALDGGTFTTVGTNVVYSPGVGRQQALFIAVRDGSEDNAVWLGLHIPKGYVTDRDDAVFSATEPALLGVEFAIHGDVVLPPYHIVFDPATFPGEEVVLDPTWITLEDGRPTRPGDPDPVTWTWVENAYAAWTDVEYGDRTDD